MEIDPESYFIPESHLSLYKTTEGHSVSFMSVTTDVKCTEKWRYKKTEKVIINYQIQGKTDTHKFTLDKLFKTKRYPHVPRNDIIVLD